MNEMLKTTALFIDADNVNLAAIPQILKVLMPEWTPIKMRAYGTQIGPRQSILRAHGVMPVEVIPVLPGKNSVDLVLTIDALEELFCGHADSIAIASGDSDFTPLALKIREHGRPVLIFGHLFTPSALRGAASSFHCVGCFQQDPERQVPQIDSSELESNLGKHEAIRSRMIELIHEIVETHGEATIGNLGAIINVRDPFFNPRRYGSASLSALLKQLSGFTLTPVIGKNGSVRDYEVSVNEP